MELSRIVRDALCVIADSDPVPTMPFPDRVGGTWHCPADGSRMAESHGRVDCPECGRQLPGSILYQLIEFHVHQPGSAPRPSG